MTAKLCRHIKTNGRRCKSPRLNGRDLCYFHSHILLQRDAMAQANSPITAATPTYTPTLQPIELELPILEDAESIQLSISLLVSALARNRIDSKRATAILYGLQLAAANARSITTEPFASAVVRSVVQSTFGTGLVEEAPAIPEAPAPVLRLSAPAPAPDLADDPASDRVTIEEPVPAGSSPEF